MPGSFVWSWRTSWNIYDLHSFQYKLGARLVFTHEWWQEMTKNVNVRQMLWTHVKPFFVCNIYCENKLYYISNTWFQTLYYLLWNPDKKLFLKFPFFILIWASKCGISLITWNHWQDSILLFSVKIDCDMVFTLYRVIRLQHRKIWLDLQ